jgi:hypothetical protein
MRGLRSAHAGSGVADVLGKFPVSLRGPVPAWAFRRSSSAQSCALRLVAIGPSGVSVFSRTSGQDFFEKSSSDGLPAVPDVWVGLSGLRRKGAERAAPPASTNTAQPRGPNRLGPGE